MKTASSPLIAHLATNKQFLIADLYTLTLSSGSIYRFTSYDAALFDGSHTWLAGGPVIERNQTRSVIGLEVDTLTLKISPKDSDMLGSLTWFQAACAGVLDSAAVRLDRAFLSFPTTVIGTINMFVGNVAQLSLDRATIDLTVNSPLEILSTQMPRNLYQAGCQHTLFDSGCALNRATYAVSGSVGSAPTVTTIAATLGQAAGYFDLGALQFTSGVLSGTKRTVKRWSGTSLTLLNPLPSAPGVGDSFTVWPGCDKQQGTCTSKFSNVVNFKGFPFVPVPETSI